MCFVSCLLQENAFRAGWVPFRSPWLVRGELGFKNKEMLLCKPSGHDSSPVGSDCGKLVCVPHLQRTGGRVRPQRRDTGVCVSSNDHHRPPATPSIQTESPVASPSTPAPGLLSVLRQPLQLCAGWKGVAGRRAPTSYTAGGYLGAVLLPGATGMSTEPSPLSLLPEQTAVSFREGACPQLQGSAQTWGREVITGTFISSRRHLL